MQQFLEKHKNSVRDFEFEKGNLVLYWNTLVEKEASQKSKPRYLGPMVVVQRMKRGCTF